MHNRFPSHSTTCSKAALAAAAVVLLGLAVSGIGVVSHVLMAPSAVPAEMSVPIAKGKQPRHLSSATNNRLTRSGAGPAWNELTETQTQVLIPLRERWSSMGELTKRRWMSLADSFDQLKPEDQETLRTRMRAWANLSVQQRNQARLNFFASRQLSPEDLQAKWDEYQALSAEEKRRLAAKAQPKVQGAATALRPQNKRNLAKIPAANSASHLVANPPKIPAPAPSVQSGPLPNTPIAPPPSLAPVQASPVTVPQNATVIELPPLTSNSAVHPPPNDSHLSPARVETSPIHPPQ